MQLRKPLRVLAIGAHPDDIEIQCAGTLIKCVARGDDVTIALFTKGDMGDATVPPDQLAVTRSKEAQASASILGAKLIEIGVTDEMVFPDSQQRSVMIDLLRESDPDLIITHSPDDYHPDHRYVSQLVFDSYFQKGLPHIPGQRVPACRFGQCQIYLMDNLGGIGFLPTEYVDISGEIDKKKAMLDCHQSQVVAMRDLANTDLIDMMLVQCKFRGLAAGCAYAEGFRRVDAYQRGLTSRILP